MLAGVGDGGGAVCRAAGRTSGETEQLCTEIVAGLAETRVTPRMEEPYSTLGRRRHTMTWGSLRRSANPQTP